MGDFVTNNNNCGQNLLQLVPSGNATLAELMRLKELMFLQYSDSIQNNVLKNTIIFDLAYFKAANIHEEKIENDPILQECDENLRENYSDVLTRFYLVFEIIHKYIT
ncbi:WASH complex subunit 5-like [Aphidius gifuensis]|uniref:WASH complex subunit 5-like n=1 Tax=Aphidius gifuensis TaxID=684658 RepID=UPI001CDD2F0B|nr:WASH complex subunit 5-like [Aphidius gifuensis]